MTISIRQGLHARLLAVMAAGCTAAVMASAGPAQAAVAQYGPPVPVPAGIPGGFSTVIITQTIGTGGGTIGPLSFGPAYARRATQLTVRVRVPAGAFPRSLNLSLTRPNVSAISVPHWPRYRAYAGLGVFTGSDGSKFHGTFSVPLKLWLTSGSIVKSDILLMWRGRGWIRVRNSIHLGQAYATFSHDPAFVLMHRIRHSRAGTASLLTRNTHAAGTSAVSAGTGIPALDEALGVVLLLAGAAGAVWARRRRGARHGTRSIKP